MKILSLFSLTNLLAFHSDAPSNLLNSGQYCKLKIIETHGLCGFYKHESLAFTSDYLKANSF